MVMGIRKNELVIDDDFKDNDLLFPKDKGRGHVPEAYQAGMFADKPDDIKLIPESEWDARIQEIEDTKSAISHMLLHGDDGKPIPSLDQGQWGYCWAHSTTGAGQAARAIRGEKYVPLSAFSIAATIKRGANEGGWCGQSAKFAEERGWMPQSIWPQGDANYRKYDKPENWAKAKSLRATETFFDLTKALYDQSLSFQQVMTLLLLRIPCALDFNWWSHSVLGADPVRIEAGSYGVRIRNSWSDSWGDKGFSVLRGSKARPDSAIAIRSTAPGVPV